MASIKADACQRVCQRCSLTGCRVIVDHRDSVRISDIWNLGGYAACAPFSWLGLVRPCGRPRTRWRDFIRHLAWECLGGGGVTSIELMCVDRRRDVCWSNFTQSAATAEDGLWNTRQDNRETPVQEWDNMYYSRTFNVLWAWARSTEQGRVHSVDVQPATKWPVVPVMTGTVQRLRSWSLTSL